MNIRSTDTDDFKLVYESNYSLLVQVVFHIVSSLDTAEDLVQETFERFYIKNMDFPSPDDARYWLLRVAKNLALNQAKKEKRNHNLAKKVSSMEDVSSSSSAEDDLIASENVESVKRILSLLPEALRIPLILKEYSDLDYKAIGKVLGISEGNVKVRIFRARKKVRNLLEEEKDALY
ncbi:MAG TPA: RNA polymerase sigma factor [Candidatus Ornithospirochaeta avicola]|uniref:RNA polymerase sigma factor n=1 Tax=Candidatus Ornithospirochaeta avicola TaxID=2840896 RepID=A0A9D1PSY2_9SPIO|nr:RNA polymerase sigma factor [Candidatus Ornithospirochaeta avicola]